MSSIDLHNDIFIYPALTTQAISSDTTTAGEIIDTGEFHSLEFVILSGTLTDGTYTVLLQEGDDSGLSDAATVDSDFVLGSLPVFAATDDDTAKRVGYVGKKRYVRLNIVSASTSTGGTVSSVAIAGTPAVAPTATQA